MPVYELFILLKAMPKPELVASVKRTANVIFDKGGIIKKIEYFGLKPTPYKISAHDIPHRKANYFLFEYIAPSKSPFELKEYYERDVDVVKQNIFKTKTLLDEFEEKKKECTLEDELKPPAYREDVQNMIKIGKKETFKKYKFAYNSGLDYYPFQK